MKIGLHTWAQFTWDFGQKFLVKVGTGDAVQCFAWSDPEYGGDNTIRPYKGNPLNFTHVGFCGRDKGHHFIVDYCGPDVKFVDC